MCEACSEGLTAENIEPNNPTISELYIHRPPGSSRRANLP
jgi:hypothetical protein